MMTNTTDGVCSV